MSSPGSFSPYRRSSFLLGSADEARATKGTPAPLAMIINKRATAFAPPRDEETGLVDWALHLMRDDPGAEAAEQRSLAEDRRLSAILHGPHVRSMRLIGNSSPRYRWQRYWKTEEQLRHMKPKIRKYYQRTNYLVQQYLYIDKILDSSLPHDLLNEYNNMPASAFRGLPETPNTIQEESTTPSPAGSQNGEPLTNGFGTMPPVVKKVKRTPKSIYRVHETTPLFAVSDHAIEDDDEDHDPWPEIPPLEDEGDLDSSDPVVAVAIYLNFAANFFLLAAKIAVIIKVPSVSVLASLVDAVLDFLSTAIVWTTTWLISQRDQYSYPVGRRKLEPLGVLVFSAIMITSFVQVSLQAIQHLFSGDHEVIQLTVAAIVIMLSTVVIKGLCWMWCRLVRNSSVRALASDALTDVIFNTGSIAFPIVGFYLGLWWLDALGGLILSLVVIMQWSKTSSEHIRNLSGFSATADQRNVCKS